MVLKLTRQELCYWLFKASLLPQNHCGNEEDGHISHLIAFMKGLSMYMYVFILYTIMYMHYIIIYTLIYIYIYIYIYKIYIYLYIYLHFSILI